MNSKITIKATNSQGTEILSIKVQELHSNRLEVMEQAIQRLVYSLGISGVDLKSVGIKIVKE